MRKVLAFSLLTAALCTPAASQIFETRFGKYPNMACQIINGFYANKPGLLSVTVVNYHAGVFPLPIVGTWNFNAAPLHVLKGGDTGVDKVQVKTNRAQSCGIEFCVNLLDYGPDDVNNVNPIQGPRARVPNRNLPGPVGIPGVGDYGYGWNLLEMDAAGFDLANLLDCDEYPYASSLEGGGTALINCIMGQENSGHGSELGGFTGRLARLSPYHLTITEFPSDLVDFNFNPPVFHCPVTCIRGNFGNPYPNLLQVTPEIACVI